MNKNKIIAAVRNEEELNIPIVAGGLIASMDEITELLSSGATAVSTGKKEF